jgi:hypothetical protein
MIKVGVSQLNQAKSNGIIRGVARLENGIDHSGIEVIASPGRYRATTDRQGNYELQHLAGAMYTLSFSKKLYHEAELSNIAATEDGSYRTSPVELKQDTTCGWRVLPNVPFSHSNDASLIASPDGDLFLGTGSARGIYRSDDDGSSWKPIHEVSKEQYLGQIVIVGPRSLISLVRPSRHPPQYIAFHQSTDKGRTWNRFELPTNGTSIEKLISCETNAYAGSSPPRTKDLEAAEEPTIIRSTDRGLSWQIASSFKDAILVKPIYCAADGSLFAITMKDTAPQSCRLYLSNDKAMTWTTCADFPFQVPFWVAGLIQDEGNRFICAGTYSETENPSEYCTAVLRSSDPLKGWEFLSKINTSVDSQTAPLVRSTRSKNLYLRTESEILVSTDNGFTWQREFRDEENGKPLVLIQSSTGRLLMVVFYPATEGNTPESEAKSKLWISDSVK